MLLILIGLQFQDQLTFVKTAGISAPTPMPAAPVYHPIELWPAIAILGVSGLTLFRQEIQRFNRHREREAQQAVDYVVELRNQNFKLSQEVKALRNQILELRVRLAQAEKIEDGEEPRRPREY